DKGKVALRYGPLVYNIEQADQDITAARLPANATLTPEWRAGFLGGVTVLTSTFADGTPMVAVPNLVRTNRQAPGPDPSNTPPAPPPVAGAPPAPRPAPPAPTSILWIPETSGGATFRGLLVDVPGYTQDDVPL